LLDLAYGPGARQRIDVFPCGRAGAATALFFHGGFWTRNGKDTFRFLLEPLHQAGLNAAFAGYTLAPVEDFGDIVGDAASVTQWLAGHLADLGLASRPLLLIGWSAGAHLVATQMHLSEVAAGVAVSGIFDLEPMRLGSANEFLNLSEDAVERYSPTRSVPDRSAPLIVAYGADELPEFRRQSVEFHEAWERRGLPVCLMSLAGRHHHSVLEEFQPPAGLLGERLIQLSRLSDG
jgi:acetyl esterase/lipase